MKNLRKRLQQAPDLDAAEQAHALLAGHRPGPVLHDPDEVLELLESLTLGPCPVDLPSVRELWRPKALFCDAESVHQALATLRGRLESQAQDVDGLRADRDRLQAENDALEALLDLLKEGIKAWRPQ